MSASRTIGTDSGIPSVPGVAVSVTGGRMEPTPVRIEHDGALLSCAAPRGCALFPANFGVNLSRLSTDLLSI